MPIRALDPVIVNQIAAGEVIERPASVVKELVENAIDAGATRIDVAIEGGGQGLIRVTDDGGGIPFDELVLALAAHATSKIERTEDLDHIATMGFRGEALASIASVSRLRLRSRPPEQTHAGLIEADGGAPAEPRPDSGPIGTTIEVRTLFFNVPARRKFMRTERTESGRCLETVQSLALAHPAIAFTARADEKMRLELPGGQSPRERVVAVVGSELAPELLEASGDERGVRIWGLVGTPDLARGTTRHQRIYLNGRPIVDRSVQHAIKEAYRGLIEPARHPMVTLFLEMDPADVDVNVHPTKAEVRFRNGSSVHGAVLSALRAALAAADLTPGFELGRPPSGVPMLRPSAPPPVFGASGGGGATSSSSGPRPAPGGDRGFDYRAAAAAMPPLPASTVEPAPLPQVTVVPRVLQVHSSYLVTEDAEGMLIVDQHALHERVMFERLRERVDAGPLETQRMLVPVSVRVDPREVDALDDLQPLLARLGIEAERLGPSSIAVHAFTTLLFERKVDPVTFMAELLARAAGDGLPPDPEAALHEVLDMMSCKAAVKAGERLSDREIADLLAERERVERSSNCPHGRPTSLRLTVRDLEKQFGRG